MTRIAFYAPLKSPRHGTPSGDRTIARLLLAACRRQGAKVEIASHLRARISDPAAQQRLARRAIATAERLISGYRQRPKADQPTVWLTYHCYYKAVDWIGPKVAAALGIPYLLVEASHAPKRAVGDWAFNHAGAEAAIRAARLIFCLNPSDKECLAPLVGLDRLIDLPPFLDLQAFAPDCPDHVTVRAKIAKRHKLDPAQPWLLAVGMMRPGDKLSSYRELAEALTKLNRRDWQLLVIGDGIARNDVAAAFNGFGGRVHLLGRQDPANLPDYYAAADLLVWPAVNEAFCMALLEAQACGLPVLAGKFGGVSAIIDDNPRGGGRTGWLAPPHDPETFAEMMTLALGSDLAMVRKSSRCSVEQHHDIASAAAILDNALGRLLAPQSDLPQ
jgi:glycosyltransferase involved in cell wall biosynthesis